MIKKQKTLSMSSIFFLFYVENFSSLTDQRILFQKKPKNKKTFQQTTSLFFELLIKIYFKLLFNFFFYQTHS